MEIFKIPELNDPRLEKVDSEKSKLHREEYINLLSKLDELGYTIEVKDKDNTICYSSKKPYRSVGEIDFKMSPVLFGWEYTNHTKLVLGLFNSICQLYNLRKEIK